ncbi:hypothetical protein IQ06DRAFT_74193 [Phaeosphaeriaceae sp. SRC1lsM3a]|nr:hypothetical protein IQ06DRAFT_74193 [Stagonospora sp. SRC1lsM3a]
MSFLAVCIRGSRSSWSIACKSTYELSCLNRCLTCEDCCSYFLIRRYARLGRSNPSSTLREFGV